MPDYQKSVIYKVSCKDTNITEFYIGSTANFRQRKYDYNSKMKNEKAHDYKSKYYKFIRENGGWENWNMEIYEYYPCNTKEELEDREDYWVVELKSPLNTNRPRRSKKEYRQDMKEVLSEKSKEYREANKEVIREKKKQYHEENKEKIAEQHKKWYEVNREKVIERVKNYRETHEEEVKQKNKEWRERNKEKISEERSVKVCCEICQKMISVRNMPRHKKEQHEGITRIR